MSVQILMSTYNGEKYLRTQLDSILSQSYQNFRLLVRDDGSSDGTQDILEEYAQSDERISWFQGENLGAALSFFELINKADLDEKYYAFADQDDLWMSDKLERAIKVLNMECGDIERKVISCGDGQVDIPRLYCGAKILVDEQLNTLKSAVSIEVKELSFGNALVQNVCTGCTCMLNRELMLIAKEYTPQHMIMHDWWFYLLASGMGNVYYDQQPKIYYRQHGRNTSGAMVSQTSLLKYRLKQLFSKRGDIYDQLEEFEHCFAGQLRNNDKKMLHIVIVSRKSFLGKLKVVCNRNIFRQKRSDNCVFKMIVLMGKL